MLDNDLLLKILKKTLSSGGEYADVFVEHRKPASIQLEDNKIEKIFIGIDSGVGIRLISNNKTFYAISNDMSEKALRREPREGQEGQVFTFDFSSGK